MNLYPIAKKIIKLIPNYDSINQLYIYIMTNNTVSQLTKILKPIDNIKLTFIIDSIKNNFESDSIEWLVNNNLYVFEVIYFGTQLGEKKCGWCDGVGKFTCDECDGTSYINCDECDGTGESYDEDEDECYNCGGDGDIMCQFCDGTGDLPCEKCDGEGYVDDTIPTINVDYLLSYDPELEILLERYILDGTNVGDSDFSDKYPIIGLNSHGYSSDDLPQGVSDMIESNLEGNSYINDIHNLDINKIYITGSKNQRLNYTKDDVLNINENIF